ncbi:hypothetical protein BJ138DRAFT_1113116 [Hygrophoropsis aurantiaca]|uniref:Uncharacterized protein n=1 Tax=Hygrophoropsis aurantiaca TaxID=72124 RepID=A0ACB8AE11_9AGAM|nr:hypothetical protein BJ138DRAFT_1113116 [Hygrophoropsis aurantiaca]
MNQANHQFLFSLNDKKSLTTRQIHIRRLNDVLHLSLHRGDIPRAKRAWAILARCKEVDWKTMWITGVHLVEPIQESSNTQTSAEKIEYLRTMMLQCPEQQERILSELVYHYILSENYKEALDELEFYLPSFPYHDNPVLHIYAGLLSIYMAQPAAHHAHSDLENGFDDIMLSRAQIFLERAKALDADNTVANAFLSELRSFSQGTAWHSETNDDSDREETLSIHKQAAPPQPKRARLDTSPI